MASLAINDWFDNAHDGGVKGHQPVPGASARCVRERRSGRALGRRATLGRQEQARRLPQQLRRVQDAHRAHAAELGNGRIRASDPKPNCPAAPLRGTSCYEHRIAFERTFCCEDSCLCPSRGSPSPHWQNRGTRTGPRPLGFAVAAEAKYSAMTLRSLPSTLALTLAALSSACRADVLLAPDANVATDASNAEERGAGAISDSAAGDGSADESSDARLCDNRPETGGVPTCLGCPGERPGANCYPPQQDGGIYGRCRLDGEDIEGKVIGAYCCNHDADSGMLGHTVASRAPADGGECVLVAPPSVLICSRCGDGICSSWENVCNCPRDCP
jgi:hypothetical protein